MQVAAIFSPPSVSRDRESRHFFLTRLHETTRPASYFQNDSLNFSCVKDAHTYGKKWSEMVIKRSFVSNQSLLLCIKEPLFFQFDQFLDSWADIHQGFALLFLENLRHLKLSDLSSKNGYQTPSQTCLPLLHTDDEN